MKRQAPEPAVFRQRRTFMRHHRRLADGASVDTLHSADATLTVKVAEVMAALTKRAKASKRGEATAMGGALRLVLTNESKEGDEA